jgi:hypothetical protein
VDGSVEAKRLLDDLGVERELLEAFVGNRREILAQYRLLLSEKLLNEVRILSKTEQNPSDGGRRRMLTSHKKGNHDTGNLVLRHLCSVLVLAVHQVPDHVVRVLLLSAGPPLADNLRVQLDHGLAGVVTRTVVGKRGPRQHKVDGGEAHVEVVVQLSKPGVEGFTDLLALKRARGGVDGELGHVLGHVKGALLALEALVALHEVLAFLGDEGNVGAEGVLGKTKLDKLRLRLAEFNT